MIYSDGTTHGIASTLSLTNAGHFIPVRFHPHSSSQAYRYHNAGYFLKLKPIKLLLLFQPCVHLLTYDLQAPFLHKTIQSILLCYGL